MSMIMTLWSMRHDNKFLNEGRKEFIKLGLASAVTTGEVEFMKDDDDDADKFEESDQHQRNCFHNICCFGCLTYPALLLHRIQRCMYICPQALCDLPDNWNDVASNTVCCGKLYLLG